MEAKQVYSIESALEEEIFHPVGRQIIFLERKKRVCFGENHPYLRHCVANGRRFRFPKENIWFASSSEQQTIVDCKLQQ